jgi:integrase/recombinase XerD
MVSNSYLIANFKTWLQTLNYSASRASALPRMLEEYSKWLVQINPKLIIESTASDLQQFMEYTAKRPNNKQEGSITSNYINEYLTMFNTLNNYFTRHTQPTLPINTVRWKREYVIKKQLLSEVEIQLLYKTTTPNPLGIRDCAMLAIYYGCGLRRVEGVNLNIDDVLIERQLLHIRKSKTNKARYTPITTPNLQHILNYMYSARPLLLKDNASTPALFVSERGTRISVARMNQCVNTLYQNAGITKGVGIHGLRHSIATHLLQRGMDLEQIGLFLGHTCLDSTQIYTHLLHEK